ncbi:MAG: hypothetical protein ACSLE3_05885 [Microbacteriaceae bacterium]
MPLVPGYGETPVSGDELDALLPSARELLGAPITLAAVYDLEQAVQDGEAIRQYDWEIDKTRYISLLRKYDASRDIRELAAFIPIRQLEE